MKLPIIDFSFLYIKTSTTSTATISPNIKTEVKIERTKPKGELWVGTVMDQKE